MIIAVTGTPGTGKTSVSEALARRLDSKLVDINALVDNDGVETMRDPDRDTAAVDTEALVAVLEKIVPDDAVLDGHLSHHYPADLTVVLRCDPVELAARLEARGWDDAKIRENVEAETLDIILQEAVAARDRVAELDTTDADPDDIAAAVASFAGGDVPADHRPGNVDWTETFFDA